MLALISILLNIVITGIIFIAFLFTGIVKKRKGYIYAALLTILAGSIWILTDLFSLGKKAASSILRSRSGVELYESLLGQPPTKGATILHYRDQYIPKIDVAIELHFTTSPDELRRILNRKPFICTIIIPTVKEKQAFLPSGLPEWFRPDTMYDSIFKCTCIDDNGNGQEIYSSADSTEVYLRDISD